MIETFVSRGLKIQKISDMSRESENTDDEPSKCM